MVLNTLVREWFVSALQMCIGRGPIQGLTNPLGDLSVSYTAFETGKERPSDYWIEGITRGAWKYLPCRRALLHGRSGQMSPVGRAQP